MDEIGFQMSHSQRESVVFDRRTGPPLSIASGSTGWVSAIEAISASSDVLMPLVIHRGRKATQPPDCWFPPSEECPNWRWGFTDKGWTNNVYSLEWLREIFIPLTRRGRSIDDKSYWRLLILDGHGSHITGEFIFECLFHQITLVYLLPHTSHLCQPCDLGPFAQLKSYYSKNLKSFIATGQTQVSRAEFDRLYHLTRQEGFTENYINAGWRRSGLWPINKLKVLERPQLSQYRQTTPDLAPPQTSQNLTPQDKWEYGQINEVLAAILTRSGRKMLT